VEGVPHEKIEDVETNHVLTSVQRSEGGSILLLPATPEHQQTTRKQKQRADA
jgi:hypothetical protein